MEIRQLRYFISVAEHLNFTEAAKQLFVAQSAVSQQIAALETQVGAKLFLRNKRSVQLTNAGSVFLKEAIEIVDKCEMAVEITRKAELGLVGTLKIGFLAAPVRRFLPHLIRKFRQKYPNIEIKLHHFDFRELNEGLKNDYLDIAFNISLGLPNIGGLECKTLYSDSCSVYVHCDHPLAQKTSVKIADLAREPFVVRDREESPQFYDYTLMLCAKNGFSPIIISQTRRIETVLILVDSGIGIAILPKYLQVYSSPTLRSIKIDEAEEDKIDLVAYRKKTNMNPSIPLFLEELQEVVSQDEAFFRPYHRNGFQI